MTDEITDERHNEPRTHIHDAVADSDVLQKTLVALAFVSLFTSLIVIITYVYMMLTVERSKNEKKSRSRTLNLLFTIMTFILSIMLLLEPLTGEELFRRDQALCIFQGTLILFLLACMVWFWFFITARLLLLLYFGWSFHGRNWVLVVSAFGLASLSSLPPAFADAISFEYVWCFIDSREVLWLYGFFYGILGFVCMAGLVLWLWLVIYIFSLYRAYLKEKNKEGSFINLIKSLHDSERLGAERRRASRKQREAESYNYDEEGEEDESNSDTDSYMDELHHETRDKDSLYPRLNNNNNDNNNNNNNNITSSGNRALVSKNVPLETFYLLLRQIIFVFVFVVLFAATFFNHLYLTVMEEATLWGWIVHVVVMCWFGISTFVVFGLTRENFRLWSKAFTTAVEAMRGVCASYTDTTHLSIPSSPSHSQSQLPHTPAGCGVWWCCWNAEAEPLKDVVASRSNTTDTRLYL